MWLYSKPIKTPRNKVGHCIIDRDKKRATDSNNLLKANINMITYLLPLTTKTQKCRKKQHYAFPFLVFKKTTPY